MLAQIERLDGNPTISTLWKISNGMKVPFDALTVRPENLYQIVKTSEIQPLLEDNGKVRKIYADSQPFIVGQGESIRFRADTVHSYKNAGDGTAILHMIIYNP